MKIDLHIHTIRNQHLDRNFLFSKDYLREYVLSNGIEVIAVTNHNLFDENNFNQVKTAVSDLGCKVFPGMEISLEGGHVLVIFDDDSCNYTLLKAITNFIKTKETNDQYRMSITDFNNLVCGHDALIIPHYEKKPKVPKQIISLISDNVFAGEVDSPKKFYLLKKGDMVPVLFSDLRIGESDDFEYYRNRNRFTYLDVDTPSFKSICTAISENRTYISKDKMEDMFDILNGQAQACTGINVLIGKRSSGKTYTLDHVSETSNDSCLYIKQFEITDNCSKEEFEKYVIDANKKAVLDYLSDLDKVFDYVDDLDANTVTFKFNQYIDSLKECANEATFDLFSKCGLYHYSPIAFVEETEINNLLNSISTLLEASDKYSSIIEHCLTKKSLVNAYAMLLAEKKKIRIKNDLIKRTNSICQAISKQLGMNTGAKQITKYEPYNMAKLLYAKKKFDNLIKSINSLTIEQEIIANKFTKATVLEKQKDKRSWKSLLGVSQQQNIDYLSTLEPFDAYVHYMNDASIIKKCLGDERYKLFFKYTTKVLNKNGADVSGGQRAEYMLLEKLSNYKDYQMVLIDEMESSFDNPFLNGEVISIIKRISQVATVIISTHNNNLGVSLKPDYYIYHEVEEIDGVPMYHHYCGKACDEELVCPITGETKKLSNVLIDTMEANREAYDSRKVKYEIN